MLVGVPVNVSYALVPAAGDPVSGSLELWATRRLPFEPVGELKFMREELRERLRGLRSDEGCVLHAVYASANRELVDVENVLIFNVGAACLTAATAWGLRFERGFQLPSPRPAFGFEPTHYHRYSLAAADGDVGLWRRGVVWASWDAVAVPPLGEATKVHKLWLQLRPGARSHGAPGRMVPFGVRMHVVAPGNASARPAAFVKPLLDAAICALHSYRGDSVQLNDASTRIAALTASTPQIIEDLLISDSVAVLGPRRTVSPYRQGIKWDPADDLCLAAEVLVSRGQASDWRVTGEVFELIATSAEPEAQPAPHDDTPARLTTSAPQLRPRAPAPASPPYRRAGGRDEAAPAGWRELRTVEEWEQIPVDRHAVLVVNDTTDRAKGGPVCHRPGCSFAKRDHFVRKVVTPLAGGKRPNGRYYWALSSAAAEAGGARACRHPSDPLNR